MKFKIYLLGLALLTASGFSHAALECKFTSNDPLLLMSPGVMPNIVPRPVGSTNYPTLISSTAILETTPALTSKCEVGDDGEDVYMMSNNAMISMIELNGKGMFNTNIPGIYFTLAFYPDSNSVTAYFPPVSGGNFIKTGDSHEDEDALNGKTWHARLEFYQNNQFTGVPKDVNFLSIGSGPIGQILLGEPRGALDDHPRPYVNLSQMSFNIPLDRPTCAVRGPVIVNLGDWFPHEVTSSGTPLVPFHITGNCANTTMVKIKAYATHWTDDKQFITNQVTAPGAKKAGGVGLEVRVTSSDSQADQGMRLTENTVNWAIAVGDNMTPTVYEFDTRLLARLVKYGNDPVTPGGFGANVTFQVTYE